MVGELGQNAWQGALRTAAMVNERTKHLFPHEKLGIVSLQLLVSLLRDIMWSCKNLTSCTSKDETMKYAEKNTNLMKLKDWWNLLTSFRCEETSFFFVFGERLGEFSWHLWAGRSVSWWMCSARSLEFQVRNQQCPDQISRTGFCIRWFGS